MSRKVLFAVVTTTILSLTALTQSAKAQEAASPFQGPVPIRLTEPEDHPSRYSKQPLWAQRVAADQAIRREQDRMRGYYSLRPNAASLQIWNRPALGMPTAYYLPAVRYAPVHFIYY